ncbi:MAG TPA: prepilin-type N-terminal cleavage/methylation domain-containing protein [Candidatus Saccharimonadia bacterium]|nr:prepilin-type N-terminal cleavage/methylation domain-containing protein [Candidatus Saccharimonadia bacterium]
MFKHLRSKQGFTLLELLIVIVIIGILALLIIPNITSAPKKARDTQRKTDLKAIQKGLEEYFVSNNVYPNALSDLTASNPPILKTVPTDPKNSGEYVYTYTPANTNSTYTLHGCLENGGDSGTGVVSGDSACTSTSKGFQLVNNN